MATEVQNESSSLKINLRSKVGVKYIDLLTDEGILIKETITSEDEIRELQKLTDEKKPLPDNIFTGHLDGKKIFIKVTNAASDMSAEEIDRYLNIRKTNYIRAMMKDIAIIKGWVIFFGVTAVIGLVAGFILAFAH